MSQPGKLENQLIWHISRELEKVPKEQRIGLGNLIGDFGKLISEEIEEKLSNKEDVRGTVSRMLKRLQKTFY